MAKNIALGKKIAAIAGKDKMFGKAIDNLPHKSKARLAMAKRKKKK
jgi:hypothetical protein